MEDIIIPRSVIITKNVMRAAHPAFETGYFIGMNWWAARWLRSPFPFPKTHAVILDPGETSGSGGWTIEEVLLHEQQEAQLMQLGLDYPDAHFRTMDLVGNGQAATRKMSFEEACALLGNFKVVRRLLD